MDLKFKILKKKNIKKYFLKQYIYQMINNNNMKCNCPKQSKNCFQCELVAFYFRNRIIIHTIIIATLLVLVGQVQDNETR